MIDNWYTVAEVKDTQAAAEYCFKHFGYFGDHEKVLGEFSAQPHIWGVVEKRIVRSDTKITFGRFYYHRYLKEYKLNNVLFLFDSTKISKSDVLKFKLLFV